MKHLQMELTNHCNLSCVECPQRLMERERRYMSEEVFQAVFDKIITQQNVHTAILHKDGEPLLHPKYEQYVGRICESSPATKIDTYTNGFLLRPELVRWIKAEGFQNKFWFLVSFHFYNADESFNDYSEVNGRLLDFIKEAPRNVDIILATHVTDLVNQHFLNEWRNEWKVVALEYERLTAVHINEAINPWAGRIKQSNAITFPACPYADSEHLFIGVTGNVIACCMDLEEEIVFGNILDADYDTVLAKRSEFYADMQKQEITEDVCRRCLAG